MLNLDQYSSLGAALRDAVERYSKEICLIEADRQRENCRLTYRDFKAAALPLAAAMQENGFAAGDRAAIIMSNQSKWLISAYAIFYAGGVLVPLDFMLSAPEHLRLLDHSKACLLITEYHLWRAIAKALPFKDMKVSTVLVTDAPPDADLLGATRWETAKSATAPVFVPRTREDAACIVYSSGTGGRPKGCVLRHENYLEQCKSLTSLYPFRPGVRYLSIIPTNHALDFMVGFVGSFVCGATVVHLRTLRPEFFREAFVRYKITHMTVVPRLLKDLEAGLRARFAELTPRQSSAFERLIAVNRALTKKKPRAWISRLLLRQVHKPFGGRLQTLFVGGAFTDPDTMRFFYDLGIPVAQGYGLTEACTVVTVNDLRPFRADTVGTPLPGTEIRIANPDAEGVGEVAVRGKTVMSSYLDDPDMTAETIVDGWLMTGDVGRIDPAGHLQLVGRKKNMIVTEGGKNVYPEDIEAAFEGLPVKEFCVFAANYIWPKKTAKSLAGEELVIVLRLKPDTRFTEELRAELVTRNRRLPHFKRLSGFTIWHQDFPRTASLKIKRNVLAEEIGRFVDRMTAMVEL